LRQRLPAITTSAFHHASASPPIKKSAKAETFAGHARAVGVAKYDPSSGSEIERANGLSDSQ